MSAPIAATAMASLTILTFYPINIKAFVGCGACGYVGEGETWIPRMIPYLRRNCPDYRIRYNMLCEIERGGDGGPGG
jgi:hypothetical protein